jgi:response regulator of citrate/malate metabolism
MSPQRPLPLKVLIVEDVAEMEALLEAVLQQIPGLQISGRARNGFEARLEISRRRPDAVILDEILPGESSTDLLAELVEQGIAVILTTSMEQPDHPIPLGAMTRFLKPTWETLEADQARIEQVIMPFLGSL